MPEGGKDLQTCVGTLCDRHARSLLIDDCLAQVSDNRLRSVLEAEAGRYAPADLAALAPGTRKRLERSISRLGGKRGRRAISDLCRGLK